MAYYNYYQTAVPYWGQQQYATQYANQGFVAPPQPSYTPQPGWTGRDFYSAHYGGGLYENDTGMFDYVWSRIKSLVGANAVGKSEARHWHHRVYGGLVDITSLLPADLGAAAGYEAYRLFNYHRTVYVTPLSDDREREEEALAGLAIAEATKLWSYCNRPHDKYGRREACEVSAATAERLFRRARRRERDDYDYEMTSSYGGSYDDDGYLSSEEERRMRRGSRRSRRRSSVGMGYGNSVPISYGAGGLAAAQGIIPQTSGGYPASYGATTPYVAASPYMGASPSPYVAGTPSYGGVPGYTAGMGGGLGIPAAGYGGGSPGTLGVPIAGRQRSTSFSYGGSPGYY